ncbi:cbb3-type cytochrome oxidase assembly protein CcoS [Microbulbifer agarilyticus]|uniref:cbb3-type cytochrome oxidase assembly protein CcoS n=1 Tax=Microbulbifer agarilyticus TaxID=260552 RepID=UPI001CD75B2B|nr:cbb3-type cytochrome oxidase assembly protein CcoS [Microbulbifer agarilyticus]MCA0900496.1 cbb3-type cytochrome oxidase assembly protein CcoS [Microbulbifer agarilyticus]
MDSIFLLVPIVIVFIACAVKFFFWAVNNGQYDDLETESRRILFEEDRKPLTKTETEGVEVSEDGRASKTLNAGDERKSD